MASINIAKIVLLVLQLIEKIINGLHDRGLIDQGYQKAIAESNARMLRNNTYAKEVMQRVNDMSDSDVDKLLRELEPSEPVGDIPAATERRS